MGIFDRLFKQKSEPAQTQTMIIDGRASTYSDIGSDVLLSNVVRAAVYAIGRESSKIIVQSVIKRANPVTYDVQDDDITRLFECDPNPWMTTQEFWSQVATLRTVNENVFIYPQYDTTGDTKVFRAFWPLKPITVEFLSAPTGELYIKMSFQGGESVTLPYSEIIHLRRNFGRNPLMGGNAQGQPDADEVKKAAGSYSKIVQMIPDVIESSMKIKGVYMVKSAMDVKRLQTERDRLTSLLETANNGIAAIDLAGELTPFNISPAAIDKTTMDFLRDDMLMSYGVSAAIISGDYTDSQYAAFYQSCLEDFIIQVEQAFTRHCYTQRERRLGHRVRVSDRLVQHLSVETRLKIVELAAPAGYLDEDEVLGLLGFEPKGRRRTMQSLNWANTEIASTYQMEKARKGGFLENGREDT